MSSDIYEPTKRSEIMSLVKCTDTKPELLLRSMLHAMGYRFRLHRRDLSGKPDIVLPKYRAVIFVHGCFWHQHSRCKKAKLPQQNAEFWEEKLSRNRERDQETRAALSCAGWTVIEAWECELQRSPQQVADSISQTLKRIHR